MSLFESQHYCPSCMSSVKSAKAECKVCGFKLSDYPDSPRYLKVRTVLGGKYLVGCVLGENTFSVTYMGLELSSKTKKIIKEYSPFSCCTRDNSSRSLSPADDKAELFAEGLKAFTDRAAKLQNIAKEEKPDGICCVTDIVEEKGTAYAVFDYVEGTPLKKLVKSPDTALSPKEMFAAVRPLINSLITLHKENMFYGNISPFNIIVSPDKKKAYLSGFGLYGDGNYAEKFGFNPKIGFTPIEEYKKFKGDIGGWTDIYGICTSIYYGLTGTTPPDASDRTTDDTLKDLASMGIELSENKTAALEQGMEIYERDRFKAVRALYNAMYSDDEEVVYTEETAEAAPAEEAAAPAGEEAPEPEKEAEAAPAEKTEAAAPADRKALKNKKKAGKHSHAEKAEAAEKTPEPEKEAEKEAPAEKTEAAAPADGNAPEPEKEAEKAEKTPESQPAPEPAATPLSSANSYSQVIVRRKNKDTIEIGDQRYSVKLNKLELDGMELTDDDAVSIEDMSALEYLSLNDNKIGNVEFMGSLKKLIYISAKNNFISDISCFVNLGELRELYLAGNKDLTDISVLEHLRGIRKLDLSDTGITEVYPLIYLDHLKYLNLKGLRLTQKQIKMLYAEMPTCNIRYDS